MHTGHGGTHSSAAENAITFAIKLRKLGSYHVSCSADYAVIATQKCKENCISLSKRLIVKQTLVKTPFA